MKLPLTFPCGAICASYILLLLLPRIVLGQTCYYPNGDVSTSDFPCSSEVDGLCCPLNWQCLSNGLCYLDNAQYFGRYTCTDRTWSAPGCPEICTDGSHSQCCIIPHCLFANQSTGNTDSGDQAVLQCSAHGGNWCCDHNRNPSNVCCDSTNPNDFFPLPKGTSVASISTAGPAVASAAIIGNHGNSGSSGNGDTTSRGTTTTSTSSSSSSPVLIIPTSTLSPLTTLTSTSTSTSATKDAGNGAAHPSPTSLSTSSVVSVVTSAANGGLITTTNVIIQTVLPASTPPSSSSHLGAEIGGGVGGGVALIALIALAFFLLRRRKKRRQYQANPAAEYRKSLDYMYKSNDMNSPGTAETSPEIDGTPIVGVYRGWGTTGGEGALRVVNGSERQSTASGLTGTTHARNSGMSELESPARSAFRSSQPPPPMPDQPYELPGEGRK